MDVLSKDGAATNFNGEINSFYPLYVSSKSYSKLLVIQTVPLSKIWFKDKEITSDELSAILENAEFPKI